MFVGDDSVVLFVNEFDNDKKYGVKSKFGFFVEKFK